MLLWLPAQEHLIGIRRDVYKQRIKEAQLRQDPGRSTVSVSVCAGGGSEETADDVARGELEKKKKAGWMLWGCLESK